MNKVYSSPSYIVRLKGRWYFVLDSLDKHIPWDLRAKMVAETHHTDAWAFRQRVHAPAISWGEVRDALLLPYL